MRKKIFKSQNSFIFGVSAILAIGFVVFAMNSCNKEMEQIVPENQGIVKQDATTRVKAFKEMMKSQKEGNLELRSTMTAEELIWNIEANINYTFGQSGLRYDETSVKTITIEVPELGGPMLPNVVTRVNDEVIDSVGCFFNEVDFSNKKIKLVDIFPMEGQNAIGVTTVVGNESALIGPIQPKVFEPGDDYNAIREHGCYDESPVSIGAAPTKIAEYTNFNLSNGFVATFLYNIETIYLNTSNNDTDGSYYGWNSSNPNDPSEPYDDYKYDYSTWRVYTCEGDLCDTTEVIYASDNHEFIRCLRHDEMNYYLNNIQNICLDAASSNYKTFSHIEIFRDFLTVDYDVPYRSKEYWYAKEKIGDLGIREPDFDIDDEYTNLNDCL